MEKSTLIYVGLYGGYQLSLRFWEALLSISARKHFRCVKYGMVSQRRAFNHPK